MAADFKNRLAKLNRVMVLSRLINKPPRNKKRPRCANNAAPLKPTNTVLVPTRAVTTILGSTAMTWASNGPNEWPDRKPNPSSIDRRIRKFLPLSVDMVRHRTSIIEPMADKRPASQTENRCKVAPTAANSVVAVRHVYTRAK